MRKKRRPNKLNAKLVKSPAKIKADHDLLATVLAGQHPINIPKRDWMMLQAQYDVLCDVLGCEGNDNFKESMDGLREFLGRAHVFVHGREFKSRALVE